MQLHTGVDMEVIARFERLLTKPAFLQEIYTEKERAYIGEKPHAAQTAAGLYCAKEAVAKALGRGLFGIVPREIEICHDEAGAPSVSLHGSAKAHYGNRSFALSISHAGDSAVAFCIVMGE